jgi:hypothetical protein
MGKGDGRRPPAVPDQVVASNWERVFGTRPRKTPAVSPRDTEAGDQGPGQAGTALPQADGS